MKKQQLIYFHILYWLINITFNIILPIVVTGADNNVLNYTFLIVSFIVFYVNYFFVVPFFFNPNKLYLSIIGYFLSVTCFVLLRYFAEEFVVKIIRGYGNYHPKTSLWFYFYDNIFYSTATIFFSTAICMFKLFSKSEEEKNRLVDEKKSAEIQALKTQINPHFIFNTLNNIYSLVYQKSEKALPAIEELSQLLRYSTKDLERDFIPLEKEIGYLESLIELEKLRIKNPELLMIEKKISFPNLNISPMLLVPFVENTFKHGDFSGKGFSMRISDDYQTLNFHLHNFKKQRSKDSLSGIGIGNVKKRLEILYPKKHELNIHETETEFSVDLKIDLK